MHETSMSSSPDESAPESASGGQKKADSANTDQPNIEGQPQHAARSANAVGHALLGRSAPGNAALSPVSISTAVALAYAGAGGKTAAQLADVMHFSDHAVADFGRLAVTLDDRDETVGRDGQVTLDLVDDIWVQRDADIGQAYLDTLDTHFQAKARPVDFAADPEAGRQQINAYISEQTHEKIPKLIPNGALTNDTRAVLTNAVYFKAGWRSPFAEEKTTTAPFNAPGGKVDARMMHHEDYYGRADGKNFEALKLPYMGGNLAAMVVLPDAGKLEAVQKTWTANTFAGVVDDLDRTYTRLALPKFEVRQKSALSDDLAQMGAPLAFSTSADFDAISPKLYLDEILHEAYVKIDEKGTEAAAATAIGMRATSMPPEPRDFKVDRPFFFYIYDKPTGAVLFEARITDPTEP